MTADKGSKRPQGMPWRAMVEAAVEVTWAWFRVRRQPFSVVARHLGRIDMASLPTSAPSRWPEAQRVSRAIHAISRRTPWTSTCLMQAVAAQRMLRRRSVPSAAYLGIANGNATTDPLLAHAWVRVGDRMITGFCNEDDYRVIAIFV